MVDTERLWVQAVEDVLREAGHPLTHDEALALVYGRAWGDIRVDMLERWPDMFASGDEAERLLGAAFGRLKAECDVRIPSSIALLRRLAATHPVAIVSGSSRGVIEEMLDLAGVADCVSLIVSTEDYDRGKPDRQPFALAAERLGVSPSACLVFEDSRAGVLSAKAAGMRVVGLQRAGAPPQDLSEADAVVADLADAPLDCAGATGRS